MKKRVVITGAARTPVGAYLGSLKTVPAEKLAAVAIEEALKRSNIEDKSVVDDVVLGHVESSGEAPNIGRTAAILAGMEYVPGYSVNRICGSGVQATACGYMQVLCGKDEIVVTGGAESLSRAPFYMPLEFRYKPLGTGNFTMLDANSTFHSNASPFEMHQIKHMGNTAENVVRQYDIPRADADRFAYDSQMKCKAAMERKRFDREIIPVEIKGRKGEITVVDTDEHPKANTTLEKLAALRPVFEKDGTVTAGNASGLNDGAAALVLMGDDKAVSLGLKPMTEIVDYAVAGLDPKVMGLGPVYAIRKLLDRAGMSKEDIDVYEINEAFAGQMLGCLKELDMYLDSPLYARVNPNGGAVALGHPLGCTGGRLITTAAYELLERKAEYAVVSACIGGGMGIAMLLKNCG